MSSSARRSGGELIRPGEDAFDATRAVHNAMIDKRPALIVRPAGAADVVDAVNYARGQGLPVAVPCGGHSVAGKGAGASTSSTHPGSCPPGWECELSAAICPLGGIAADNSAADGRGKDMSFVIDRLTDPRTAWQLSSVIDKRRIGMAGHSIGGASAISAMAGDKRIDAGTNLDGAFHDVAGASKLDGRPFLLMGTHDGVHRPGGRDHTWEATWARLEGWRRWLTVAGWEHFSFCEWPALAAQLGLRTRRSGSTIRSRETQPRRR